MTRWLACLAAVAVVFGCGDLARALPPMAAGSFEREPALSAPTAEEIAAQVERWLATLPAGTPRPALLWNLWRESAAEAISTTDRLEIVAHMAAIVDPRAADIVRICQSPRQLPWAASQDWLFTAGIDPWLRDNLRLYYGRWLAQHQLYDEALEQLAGVQPEQVIDPATLLFYQSVVHHRLLNKQQGLAAIDRLLTDTAGAPQRYVAVAALMQSDLEQLQDDSLDHIARRMDDIRRRLELARTGQRVVTIEDGVIASLDKLIEEMEKQQQQGGGGGGGSGSAQQPSSPMPDSRLARAQGAGDADRRNIGNTSGWGDLPPKQREEALQQIGKEFPAHYRDVIEQYFRKLASEEAPPAEGR